MADTDVGVGPLPSEGSMPPGLAPVPPPLPPGAAKDPKTLEDTINFLNNIGQAIQNRPAAAQVSGPQVGPGVPGVGAGTPSGGLGMGSTGGPPVAAVSPRPPGQPYQQFMPGLAPKAQGMYAGIQGLQSFLQTQQNRQDQKDAAEAGNVAQNLMQALDAAQNSPDERTRANAMQTLDLIMKNKEYKKVLDKVYKGWLVKADQQKKQKQQEPDPETQGFEQGLQKYFQDKSAGGAQAAGAQLPQMPSQLQGYRMPQAGPAQMLQALKQYAEARKAMDDPERLLASHLTSAEQARVERGATVGKVEAEEAKYHAETIKAATEVQRANLAVQQEQLKVQQQQLRNEEARLKGKQSEAIKEKDLQIKNVMLDIQKTKLQILKANPPGMAKKQMPPPVLIKQTAAANQALAYVDSVLNTRGKNGFTQQDIQTLTGMLNQAGASSLAKTMPGWAMRTLPAWLGGAGEDDVRGLRDALQQFSSGLETTIQERYPAWTGTGSAKSKAETDVTDEGEGAAVGDEGPAVEGESDQPDADIEISPEDMAPAKP